MVLGGMVASAGPGGAEEDGWGGHAEPRDKGFLPTPS